MTVAEALKRTPSWFKKVIKSDPGYITYDLAEPASHWGDTVMFALDWDLSTEGLEFWSEVHDALTEVDIEEPFPHLPMWGDVIPRYTINEILNQLPDWFSNTVKHAADYAPNGWVMDRIVANVNIGDIISGLIYFDFSEEGYDFWLSVYELTCYCDVDEFPEEKLKPIFTNPAYEYNNGVFTI